MQLKSTTKYFYFNIYFVCVQMLGIVSEFQALVT